MSGKIYVDVYGAKYQEQPNGSFVKFMKDRRSKKEQKAAKKASHCKRFYYHKRIATC